MITVIEVLSPWNKSAGRLNTDYRRKLEDYGRAGVSVVEIDLLRSSRTRLIVKEEDVPPERSHTYLACLRRGWCPEEWDVYPMRLRMPLPAIPIPLREDEPHAWVALQPLIERVYVSGGHNDIDYRKPARPPLKGKDAKWADELLKRGKAVKQDVDRRASMSNEPKPSTPPPVPQQVIGYATPARPGWQRPQGPGQGPSSSQKVFDTVAGPNVRLKDNLIQLVCVIVGAVIGGAVGKSMGAQTGMVIGIIAGLLVRWSCQVS